MELNFDLILDFNLNLLCRKKPELATKLFICML